MDALLGRSFKTYKFKPLVNLAVSRLAVLKNQREVRCNQARSDVVQLLNIGPHQRALLRVEQVIKEQNMLDVFVIIEGYCLLVIERVHLIEQEKDCPHELLEAVSSLIYAASRCGEFPELQEMRAVFTARFGKEFAARAIELRNNCGVNLTMIQKLSTRQPSLERRMMVLEEIASENGITLQLEGDCTTIKETSNIKLNQSKPDSSSHSTTSNIGSENFPEEMMKDEEFSGSMKGKMKYKDVADAAQEAFKSAAYAAAAARAAVELSRADTPGSSDDHDSPNPRRRKVSESDEEMKFKNEISEEGKMETQNEHEVESNQKNDSGSAVFDESDDDDIKSERGYESNTNSLKRGDFLERRGYPSYKQSPLRSQAGLKLETGHGIENAVHLNIEKRPISMRTRRGQGY